MPHHADVVIVGAGAAGLMAGIWAGRKKPNRRIVILDSAKKPGAKILIAGGGRCNVTHQYVSESDYAGSSRNAIKKVLRRFDVNKTIAFFRTLGVELKKEDTGKLFPVSDSSKSVLQSLLGAVNKANIHLIHPFKVQCITKMDKEFIITDGHDSYIAKSVVLATGGKSLPKSGSDGHGYLLAKSLGHTLSQHVFPALVPLILPGTHFICSLSGITIPATIEVQSGSGKTLESFTESTLFTHFGLSGPSVLNISRYYKAAKINDPNTKLIINFLPGYTFEIFHSYLLNNQKQRVSQLLKNKLPDRLIKALCDENQVSVSDQIDQIPKAKRKQLCRSITQYDLPVTGDRGFKYAEVTAGGIPLDQIHLDTMESRICPGLYLCGEILDVDGRIGGFNFQWAWSSGYTAGISVI
jgi:predicted Rossmann fold flavoprotein